METRWLSISNSSTNSLPSIRSQKTRLRALRIIGENGLLKQLTKALLDRATQAEITEDLWIAKHDPAGYNSGSFARIVRSLAPGV